MLSLNHRLLFPSLVYQKDFIIQGPPSSDGDNKSGIVVKNKKPSWTKRVKLYKLDWNANELQKKEKQKVLNKLFWSDIEIPYINSLPEELDEEIKNHIFALDMGYLDEIRRCSQRGVQEWNISRPFDTAIREMCLEIPQSYIRVAFILLSDCIFDEKTGYWDRGDRREEACLMLYKFWCHQTGRGVLMSRKYSGWDDEYVWQKKWTEEDGEARKRVERINELLLENNEKIDKAFSKITIDK